jgi:tetratricopeptide (TPR) repeat protein
VRLLAAVGLVRAATGSGAAEVPDAVVATLVAAVHDPDSVPGYDELACGERDLAGDIGYVLRSLPPALGLRALPTLCAALRRAEDFGTMGLVEAMLAFTFGEPPESAGGPDIDDEDDDEDDLEDMSEATAPAILDPAQLTAPQRQVLTAMAESHELWTIGNLFFVLRSHGIPTRREQLAALLGLTLARDEAGELAAQARFHRVHMHDPAQAATLLRRAVELAPTDAALWYQLAQALHQDDDNAEALLAIDRALALDPDSGAALFERGLIVVHTDPADAARAFARAAELGTQPLQARTNQSTCLAMIGRREEALQLLERLIADNPGFAEGWYSLGLALVKLGRHDASVTALDRAVALDPDHANAHYARACAHALAGRAEPALADVARAIAIDPGLRAAIRDDADFTALADTLEFQRLVAGEPVDSPSDLRN